MKGSTSDGLLGDDGEERLNEIQPAAALGSEVEMDAVVAPEPAADGGVSVGSVVVEHDVQLTAWVGSCYELEEREELLVAGAARGKWSVSPELVGMG